MVITKKHSAWIIGIIVLLVMFRFVPHPPNATPIAAMAIFAGATFSNRVLAYLIPLAVMILSDLVLGFHTTVWYVYSGVVITVMLGSTLRKISMFRVGLITVVASIIFYLITNFGAWLHHDMYSQDIVGLMQAYFAGLPFLRNSLIANIIFSYLIFYGLAWLENDYPLSKSIQK